MHFDDLYLPSGALIDLVGTADVVLLPYDSLEQATSGVLIEAVTAGKPVISTRFPHAAELLGGGAGLLVERKDPAGLADALRRAITEPGLSERMSRHAAEIAPRLVWRWLPRPTGNSPRRSSGPRRERRYELPACSVPAPPADDR